MIIATDLDRTLIYSRSAVESLGAGTGAGTGLLTPVERYRGDGASWMTTAAADAFAGLHRFATVVPVTTRTPEQWQRITLPGPPPRFAVTANGGILLVDGAPDAGWQRAVAARLREVTPLAEIWDHAADICRPEWTVSLRDAYGLFCYAVVHRDQLPAGFVAEAVEWADARGWVVSLQGRKLYWVPRPLTKSAAVAQVAARVGASTVLAAGDSLLDADLLAAADLGIAARHGELVAAGWRADHVTVTAASGVMAGAEIVDWFAARVAA